MSSIRDGYSPHVDEFFIMKERPCETIESMCSLRPSENYLESFVRVFIFAKHSESSCSPHERKEEGTRKKLREGEVADLTFSRCRVPLPAEKKLLFRNSISHRATSEPRKLEQKLSILPGSCATPARFRRSARRTFLRLKATNRERPRACPGRRGEAKFPRCPLNNTVEAAVTE